ncbi:hypothetical protein NNO07_22510 [Pseudomonas resinovorans]|uniref:Phage neck terminator protein gp12-like domain-containing protein n=1 Tax=Metapseudomonas resinovorans TaxID=53412 RepID=A0ABT4YAL5_METRE|nr:hypothetical protein [Pseudomonas resinovorans]MDA8485849.1 hypothetical protein [Pseudomonas resinovorans]
MSAVLEAMYDLVDRFTDLSSDTILRAWPNRTATPLREYAVITDLNSSRRGTNLVEFTFNPLTTEDGISTESALQQTNIQFDFIGANARDYATRIEVLSRSSILCDFLAPYEISPLFADSPRDMTSGDSSLQYAIRFVVTLTISYWTGVSSPTGWFDNATVNTEVIE